MAEAAAEYEFLVETVQRAHARLDRQLRQRPRESGQLGATLWEYVVQLLHRVHSSLQRDRERWGEERKDWDPEDWISATDRLRRLALSLERLQRCLPWLETAVHPTLPLGTRYLVDELAERVVQHPVDALTQPEIDYATEPWPFGRIDLPSPGNGSEEAPSPIPVIITYPELEERAVLRHVLFAHELGHTAVLHHSLIDDLLAEYAGGEEFERRLTEAAVRTVEEVFRARWGEEIVDQLKRFSEEARRRAEQGSRTPNGEPDTATGGWFVTEVNAWRKTHRERLRSFVTELACDLLALQVAGPSYLFGFAAHLLATSSGEEGGRAHPPTVVRIRFMLDELEKLGWHPALIGALPEEHPARGGLVEIPALMSWLADVASRDPRPPEAGLEFLVSSLGPIMDPLGNRLRDHLGPHVFRLGDYEDLAKEVTELLELLALPVEVEASTLAGRAVDRRALLLAAWMHFLRKKGGDSPDTLPRALDNDDFQRFLTRALEMSRVLETWKSTRLYE